MKRFIEGECRDQTVLFPERLDDWISEDNPVRAVDAFVEEVNLRALGFETAVPAATGRPAYHPATLLKIYIYGYLNRIQSSRQGAIAAEIDLESARGLDRRGLHVGRGGRPVAKKEGTGAEETHGKGDLPDPRTTPVSVSAMHVGASEILHKSNPGKGLGYFSPARCSYRIQARGPGINPLRSRHSPLRTSRLTIYRRSPWRGPSPSPCRTP